MTELALDLWSVGSALGLPAALLCISRLEKNLALLTLDLVLILLSCVASLRIQESSHGEKVYMHEQAVN